MVRSETPEPVGGDQSLGDLVALAAKDVSQLVRYEIDLAKTELRGDLKRVGLAGALAGAAVGVAILRLKGLSGLKRTRKSVTEGLGMLRRDGHEPAVSPNGDRPGIGRDGQQPQIAA